MNIHSFIALCSPDNQLILIDTNILNYGIFFQFSRLNEKEKRTRYPTPAQSITVLLEKLRVVPQRIKEFLTFYGTHCSLPSLQQPATCHKPEADDSNPVYSKFISILFPLLILGLFLVGVVFPTKPSKHSPSSLCVLHASIVSSRN
jgi:hypothetical protein